MILAAAKQRFAESGYERATIRAIAVRAGWSQSPVGSATYTHVLF